MQGGAAALERAGDPSGGAAVDWMEIKVFLIKKDLVGHIIFDGPDWGDC